MLILLRSQLNAKISLSFEREFENDHSKLRIFVDSRLENQRIWFFVLTSTISSLYEMKICFNNASISDICFVCFVFVTFLIYLYFTIFFIFVYAFVISFQLSQTDLGITRLPDNMCRPDIFPTMCKQVRFAFPAFSLLLLLLFFLFFLSHIDKYKKSKKIQKNQ